MKQSSILMLVVLVVSLFLPFSGHVTVAQNGSEHLLTLDVCHGGELFSFSHADIPCLCESAGAPAPPSLTGFVEVSQVSSAIPSFFRPIEQPPKA